MRIGIFGTGGVGRTLAAALVERGHDVMLGTRDVARTLAHDPSGAAGGTPFRVWLAEHSPARLGTLDAAAAHGEVLINATAGGGSIAALQMAGEANLRGKVLLDIANPLDFSRGMPPTLTVCNTDSLAEQIQRAFPALKVVKTLSTMTAALMVNPGQLADGDHHVFVSGNDAEAKAAVSQYLREWFGWREVIDLGDITSARGVEMWLPLWLRLWGSLQTPLFNVKIVK